MKLLLILFILVQAHHSCATAICLLRLNLLGSKEMISAVPQLWFVLFRTEFRIYLILHMQVQFWELVTWLETPYPVFIPWLDWVTVCCCGLTQHALMFAECFQPSDTWFSTPSLFVVPFVFPAALTCLKSPRPRISSASELLLHVAN
jgi:hypothetical protein